MKKMISILLTLALGLCFGSNLRNFTTNGIIDSVRDSKPSAYSFEVTHPAHKCKVEKPVQDLEIKYAVNIFKILVAVPLVVIIIFLSSYRRILLERRLEKNYLQ